MAAGANLDPSRLRRVARSSHFGQVSADHGGGIVIGSQHDQSSPRRIRRDQRGAELSGHVGEANPDVVPAREQDPAAAGAQRRHDQPGIVVALDTRLDDALVAEGWARDVIRHVQTLRKDAGLAVTDRIRLWLRIDDTELGGAVRTHLDAIGSEVLATEVELATGPDDAARRDFAVGGKAGTAALTRA